MSQNNISQVIDEINGLVKNETLSRSQIYEKLIYKGVMKPATKNEFLEIVRLGIKNDEIDNSKIKATSVKSQRLPSVLRLRELKKIVNVITDPKEMFIFLTAFFCGLRRGEVSKLRKEDIYIDDPNAMYLKVVQGKRKKDRYVTLAPAYVKILRLWQELITDYTSPYLVPAKNGLKPINVDYLNTRFKLNVEKAGLLKVAYMRKTKKHNIGQERMFNFHFHCLRHSFATFRIEQGDHPQNVMEELGHKDQETLQIYTHISLESRQRATNKVFGYGRELPNLVKIPKDDEGVFSYEKGQLELKKKQLEIEEKRLEIEKLKLLKEVNPFQIEKKPQS